MKVIFMVIMAGMLFNQGNSQSMLPDDLFGRNARIEKAGTGYSFTEGASRGPDGRVFFTDQPNDRIYVWDEKNGISLFMEGTERSNGTYFDRDGTLIACADLNNRLIRITHNREIIPVNVTDYEGKHFNGPNDLWIHPYTGSIYFTDPYYHRNYWPSAHRQQLEIQGVYLISSLIEENSRPQRVIDDLEQPNGIVGTPDGKVLYVADIKAKTTWRYNIVINGALSDKTKFAPAGSDGMTIDNQGNVYLTFGKVLIYNSSGDKIGEIELPESPSNLCFGGKKKDILFITARTSVYTIRMKVRGVE